MVQRYGIWPAHGLPGQPAPTIKVYMKCPKDSGYMGIIETVTDVNNVFLSRREMMCNFAGLGGKLKKLDAVEMVSKEFKLKDKVVIPIRLKSQVGRSMVTGTFYIYEDENLARKHVNPTVFARLEKIKAKQAEAAKAEGKAE